MIKKRKPLPTETPTVVIENLAHDGRGVTHLDGKTIFIDNALPGETVRFQYTARHGKFDEGLAIKIEQPSADRVEPRCPHAIVCGGCSSQHISADAQIRDKERVLFEQMAHFGNVEVEERLPPLTSEVWGYRRKARLGVKYVEKKGGALVGFREKRSSFLAAINECHVLHPKVGTLIPVLKELISQLDCRSSLPQIEVAVGDERAALGIRHLHAPSEGDKAALLAFAQTYDIDLYLQPGGPDTVHKIWPQDGHDRLSYRLPDFGVELEFHLMDFTQVNAGINRRMVKLAIDLLDVQPHERVLDLFCGLGNFTLPLATKAREVVGVEGEAAMVKRGIENAAHNGLTNVSFFGADLAKDLPAQPWVKEGFDKILIDPPRSGALEVVRELARFKAKRVVYVSCNPATLARDAGELTKLGYKLTKAGVMDMFPHTTHVESIAVFDLV
ncbi:MAG: 23S rRNA (uracil(1939)-C(5))-methyltransferase RlmD [Permianibacter sp.]